MPALAEGDAWVLVERLRYAYEEPPDRPWYVYRLWRDDVVVYVGISNRLPDRLRTHHLSYEHRGFTSADAALVGTHDHALKVEQYLIKTLRPEENRQRAPKDGALRLEQSQVAAAAVYLGDTTYPLRCGCSSSGAVMRGPLGLCSKVEHQPPFAFELDPESLHPALRRSPGPAEAADIARGGQERRARPYRAPKAIRKACEWAEEDPELMRHLLTRSDLRRWVIGELQRRREMAKGLADA